MDNLLKVEKINRPELVSQTRSGSSLNLIETRVSVVSSKTFINDAKKLWNMAPESIKNCVTLASAKKAIKIYIKTSPV